MIYRAEWVQNSKPQVSVCTILFYFGLIFFARKKQYLFVEKSTYLTYPLQLMYFSAFHCTADFQN